MVSAAVADMSRTGRQEGERKLHHQPRGYARACARVHAYACSGSSPPLSPPTSLRCLGRSTTPRPDSSARAQSSSSASSPPRRAASMASLRAEQRPLTYSPTSTHTHVDTHIYRLFFDKSTVADKITKKDNLREDRDGKKGHGTARRSEARSPRPPPVPPAYHQQSQAHVQAAARVRWLHRRRLPPAAPAAPAVAAAPAALVTSHAIACHRSASNRMHFGYM